MRRFQFVPIGVALLLTGCVTPMLESVGPVSNPAEFVVQKRPDEVRTVMADGRTRYILSPGVRADSLVGRDYMLDQQVALALSDVRRMDARRLDQTRIGVAVAGGALLLGGLVYAWTHGSGEPHYCDASPRECDVSSARAAASTGDGIPAGLRLSIPVRD